MSPALTERIEIGVSGGERAQRSIQLERATNVAERVVQVARQRLVAAEVVEQRRVVGMAREPDPEGVGRRDQSPRFAMAARPLEMIPAQVELEQPPQLDDRFLVIVDAEVDNAVDELPCLDPCTGTLDVDRGRLLATAVAAGRLRRFEPRNEPFRKRAARFAERPGKVGDDVRPGQDVALRRKAFSRFVPRPGVALAAGPGRRTAVCGHDAELPRLAPSVRREHDLDRMVRIGAVSQLGQEARAVPRDPGSLRRHRSDARRGPGHHCSNGEVLRLNGNAELARVGVEPADREGRRPAARHGTRQYRGSCNLARTPPAEGRDDGRAQHEHACRRRDPERQRVRDLAR